MRGLKSTPTPVPDLQPNLAGVMRIVRRRRVRRHLAAGLGVLAAIAAILVPMTLLVALSGSANRRSALSSSPLIAHELRIGAGTVSVAAGAGGVWVSGFDEVTKLDPRTNRVEKAVGVRGTGYRSTITALDGSVWVTAGRGRVVHVNPETGRVVATVTTEGVLRGLTAGDGYVWATGSAGGRGLVVRINVGTNVLVGQPFRVGRDLESPVYADGKLWVVDAGSGGSILAIDPSTGSIVSTGPRVQGSLAFGARALWGTQADAVLKIDPGEPSHLKRIDVRGASKVAFAGQSVWVVCAYSPVNLVRIDAATGRVMGRRLALSGALPTGIVASATTAWVASADMSIVTRVDVGPSAGS